MCELCDKLADVGFSFQSYRSGGFVNRNNDRARIVFDLPIVEAKKLALEIQKREIIVSPEIN